MEKDYIESMYKIAVYDFRLSTSEDAAFDARRRMAKLEALAAETFGFDYADSLAALRG